MFLSMKIDMFFLNQTKQTQRKFRCFALIPLENKAFAKTLRQLYNKNIFGLFEAFGTSYGPTYETLPDVKRRSKTNFLPNFVSLGGRGRSPHEVKLEAKLWDKNP